MPLWQGGVFRVDTYDSARKDRYFARTSGCTTPHFFKSFATLAVGFFAKNSVHKNFATVLLCKPNNRYGLTNLSFFSKPGPIRLWHGNCILFTKDRRVLTTYWTQGSQPGRKIMSGQEKKQTLEERILSTIIDAMLDAKKELTGRPIPDWSGILLDSCRRRRFGTDRSPFVTSC